MSAGELERLARDVERYTRLANQAQEKLLARLMATGAGASARPPGVMITRPPAAPLHGGGKKGETPRLDQIAALFERYAQLDARIVAQETGLPADRALKTLVELSRRKRAVRVARGQYVRPGSEEAKAAKAVRAPKGRHVEILRLLKRHRVLTADVVQRELGIDSTHSARALLWRYAQPSPKHPAVLVRMGDGEYAAADSPAALMAGLKEAIKPAGALKRGRPPKRPPPESAGEGKNSEPPTPHP